MMCCCNGQGQEYAPYYLIEYQRQDGGRWMRYRNRQGQVQVLHNIIIMHLIRYITNPIFT